MYASTLLARLFLAAGIASAAQNVVYWGQNGGGTIENNDLSTYCTSNSGIDVLVLAFLYSFGQNGIIPSGTIGQSCYISTAGEGQNCDALATAIGTCKAAGVKIILSLGGAVGSYTLTSDSQAQQIGNYLWQSYGNSGNTTVERPFGSNYVDGFDFDLENTNGQAYFPAMISTLRTAFATDSSHQYYITGAPQCPIPEPNMGAIIQNAVFDYLFIQFYNNNNYTYPCALPYNGNAPFNYDQWVTFTAGTPSANAQLFIGVPASPLAANGAPSGETYYITPDQLAQLVAEYKTHTRFGGIMMWSAGFSDSNVINGCTYAQEAHSILTTGATCGGSAVTLTSSKTTLTTITVSKTTTPTTTTKTTTSSSSSTTGLAQWAQCGGQGYTGPTTCASPYTCVANSVWWSQCQ